MFATSRRRLLQALGLGGATAAAGCLSSDVDADEVDDGGALAAAQREAVQTVAADPTDVPDPIDRDHSTHHEVELEAREVVAEVEDGVTFEFMTFDGQVPGPMIRVREGDALPLADATVIHFMNPVFTALAAAVVLGEHLGAREFAWEKTVVCGHTPRPEPINRDKLILIDTGCVYHMQPGMGRLTAVRLPEREFIDVEYQD